MPPLMHHPLPFTSGHPYNSTLLLSADHFINISTIISSIKKKRKKILTPLPSLAPVLSSPFDSKNSLKDVFTCSLYFLSYFLLNLLETGFLLHSRLTPALH